MATLIEQYMLLDREIKALTEQKDAVRKQIGDLSLGKTIIDDDYYLNVSVVRSFDAKAAKEFLSEAEYNRILVTKVDSALAR